MYLKLLIVAISFLGRIFTAGRPTEADTLAGKPLVRNKYMSPVVVHNADKISHESKNKHGKLNYRPVVNVQGGGLKPAGLNSQQNLQQEKLALVEIIDEPHGYNFETEPIMMDEITARSMEHSTGGRDITNEESTTEFRASPPSTTAMSTVTRNETEPFLEIEDDVTLAGYMKGRKTIISEASSGSFTSNFTGNTKIPPFQMEKFRFNNGTQLFAQDKTRIEVPGVIKTKEKGMDVPVIASYKEKLFEFPTGSKIIGNEYPAITSKKGKGFQFLTLNKQKGFELPLLSKQTGFELPPLNRQTGFELPGETNYENTGMVVPALTTYKEKGIVVPDISKVKGIEISDMPGAKGSELPGVAEVRGNKISAVTNNESGIKFPSIFNYGQEYIGFPSVTKYKVEVTSIPREKDIISHGMTKQKEMEFPFITKDKEFYIPGVNKGNVLVIPSLTKQKGVEIPAISKEKGMSIPGINKEKEIGITSISKKKEMHHSNINNEKEIVIPYIKSNKEKGIEVPGITNYKMQYPSMNEGKGIDIPDISNYKMKVINGPSIMKEKANDIPGIKNYKMKEFDVPLITKETGIDIPVITNYKMNAIHIPPITKEKGSNILGITDFKGKGAEVSSIMREKEIVIPDMNSDKVKGIGVPSVIKGKGRDIPGINNYKEKEIEAPFVNMVKVMAIPGISSYKTKENEAPDKINENVMCVTEITVYKGKGTEVPDINKQQRLKIPAISSYKDNGIDLSTKTKGMGINTHSMFKMKGLDIPNVSKEKEIDFPGLNEMKELEISAITEDKGINIHEKAKAKGFDVLSINKLNDIGVLPVGIDIPDMAKRKGSEVPSAYKDKGIDTFSISRGIDIPTTEKAEGFEIPFITKNKEIYTPAVRMEGIRIQNMNSQKGFECPSISKEGIFENPGVNNEKGIEFPVIIQNKGIGTDVPNVGVDNSGLCDLKNGIRYPLDNNSEVAKFSVNNNSKNIRLLKTYQNNLMYTKMGERKSSPLRKQFRLRPPFNETSMYIYGPVTPECTEPYNVIHSYDYSGNRTKNSYMTEKNNILGTQAHVGTYYMLSSYKPPVYNPLFINDVIFTTENPAFIVTTDTFNINYSINFVDVSDILRSMYFSEIYTTSGTVGIFVPYPNTTEGNNNAELSMTSKTAPPSGGNYAAAPSIDSLSESISNMINMIVTVPFVFYNYSNNIFPSPVEIFATKPASYHSEGQIKQEYVFGVENLNKELMSNVFISENATSLNGVDFNAEQMPVNINRTQENKLPPFNTGPKASLQQLKTKSSVFNLERKRTTSESPFTKNNTVLKSLFDKLLDNKTDVLSNYGTQANVLNKEHVDNAYNDSSNEYNSRVGELVGIVVGRKMLPFEKMSRANRLLNLKLSMMSERTRPTPPRRIMFELEYRGRKVGRNKYEEDTSREDVVNLTP